MALAKEKNIKMKNPGRRQSYGVAASTTIYKGALVAIDTDGYLIPAADTASIVCVGVADESADNSGGADGDLSVLVWRSGVFAFAANGTAPTQVNVGRVLVAESDEDVSTAAAMTNDVLVGTLEEIDGSDFWVDISQKVQ